MSITLLTLGYLASLFVTEVIVMTITLLAAVIARYVVKAFKYIVKRIFKRLNNYVLDVKVVKTNNKHEELEIEANEIDDIKIGVYNYL